MTDPAAEGPRQKTAGVYDDEALFGLRSIMRKMSFHPRAEHIWHLMDTVLYWRQLATARMNRICELEAEIEELKDRDAEI